MADRLRVAAVATLALATAACAAEDSTFLLNSLCGRASGVGGAGQAPQCQITGDAARVTGVSEDTFGIRFGPSGTGEVRIRLSAIPAASTAQWSLLALAASTRPEGSTLFRTLTWGSCGATCPPDPADIEAPVEEGYTLIRVVNDSEGAGAGRDMGTVGIVPEDAVVVFRGADIDLADLTTPDFDASELEQPGGFF